MSCPACQNGVPKKDLAGQATLHMLTFSVLPAVNPKLMMQLINTCLLQPCVMFTVCLLLIVSCHP